MPIDDVNNFDRQMKNALERVSKAHEEGEISKENKNAIRKYGLGVGDVSNSTLKDRLGHLRIIAENSDFGVSILNHTPHQINEVLFKLQTERGWSDGTKRNYEKAIRSFLRYHGKDETAEEIELTKYKSPKFRRESIILLDDLRDMLSEAESVRDQSLLATMWEGGFRITALLSLRLKDYTPTEDQYSLIEVPEAEGMKGAEGDRKPVTWARGYVDQWIQKHPTSEDPDAPLFCKYRNDRESAGESLTPQYVRQLIKEIAAGVEDMESEKIHPHSFRHGRATWMARNGYTERDIEHNMDWSEDSAQHSRYEHLLQEDHINSLLRHTGIELDDEQEEEDESVTCTRCGERVLSTAKYCPTCSLRLSTGKPPWSKVYQMAVEDSIYLEELRETPKWNMAELRPDLYKEVRSVVSEALMEAWLRQWEPPKDWEWTYPDLDIDPERAEELSIEIFGGLPGEFGQDDEEEFFNNFPSEKQKDYYEYFQEIDIIEDRLPEP